MSATVTGSQGHSWRPTQSPFSSSGPLDSQISSPVSLDSTGTGDTLNSSPTSPHPSTHSPPGISSSNNSHRFPSEPWPGYGHGSSNGGMFGSFAPPNTVAPPPHSHRPDNVHGGGAHRYSAISSRVSTETNAPIRGGYEQIQVRILLLLNLLINKQILQDTRESYTARHYTGTSNTVAPPPLPYSTQSSGLSPLSAHVGYRQGKT